MRKTFNNELTKITSSNTNTMLLIGDLGLYVKVLQKIKDNFIKGKEYVRYNASNYFPGIINFNTFRCAEDLLILIKITIGVSSSDLWLQNVSLGYSH